MITSLKRSKTFFLSTYMIEISRRRKYAQIFVKLELANEKFLFAIPKKDDIACSLAHTKNIKTRKLLSPLDLFVPALVYLKPTNSA